MAALAQLMQQAGATWDELDQLPKVEFDELLLEHKLGVLERQRVNNAVDAKRRMVAPSSVSLAWN